MPIYEYVCEPCDQRFEAFLASSSETAACPACQGTQLRRVMSTFAASVAGGSKSSQAGAPAPGPAAKPSGHTHGGGCGCH